MATRTETFRALRRKANTEPAREPSTHWRPQTYGDCQSLPRPCPYVGCRYHLMLEAKHGGSITYYAEDVAKMSATCALDEANVHAQSAQRVSELLGVSKARVDQIERVALAKLGDSIALLEHHGAQG